jgi:hypothetical protein
MKTPRDGGHYNNKILQHRINLFLIFKHLAKLTMKFSLLSVAAVLSTASAFGVPVSLLGCLSFTLSDPKSRHNFSLST